MATEGCDLPIYLQKFINEIHQSIIIDNNNNGARTCSTLFFFQFQNVIDGYYYFIQIKFK